MPASYARCILVASLKHHRSVSGTHGTGTASVLAERTLAGKECTRSSHWRWGLGGPTGRVSARGLASRMIRNLPGRVRRVRNGYPTIGMSVLGVRLRSEFDYHIALEIGTSQFHARVLQVGKKLLGGVAEAIGTHAHDSR